jgi:DNA-binding phage protein
MEPLKKVRQPTPEACVLVRGRPAQPGARNRTGVTVVVPPPPSRPKPAPVANESLTRAIPARAVKEEGADYLSHLVSHLRRERQRRGLSLADLAKGSGLDRGMLCKLENGRIANPTFHTLWRYAMALDGRPAMVFLDACRAAADAEAR